MRIKLLRDGLLLTETTTYHLIKQMLKDGMSEKEAIVSIKMGWIEETLEEFDYFNNNVIHQINKVPRHTFKTCMSPNESFDGEIEYEMIPDKNGVFGVWEE